MQKKISFILLFLIQCKILWSDLFKLQKFKNLDKSAQNIEFMFTVPRFFEQIWFCKNDLMCQTRGKRILNLKFSWVGQRLPHFLFPLRFYLTFWKGPGKPFKIPDVSEREHGWLVCIWPVCPSLAILEDWPWKWNFCAIWHAHDI